MISALSHCRLAIRFGLLYASFKKHPQIQNTSTLHRCQQKAAHPYRATLYTRDAIRFYDFSLAFSYENVKCYNRISDVIMFQLKENIYGSSPMLCFRL
jgi:hypothetical protein